LDPSQVPQPTLPTRPQQLGGGGGATTTNQQQQPLSVYYPKAHMKHGSSSSGRGGGGVEILAPPPADSRFIVLEDGNASPHMLRCTMAAMPMDRQVLRQTCGGEYTTSSSSNNTAGILGLLCTPLAIPSMDFAHSSSTFTSSVLLPPSGMMGCVTLEGSGTVSRCTRCNAYANTFWESGTCNFCGQTRNIGNVSSGTMEYKDLTGPYSTRAAMPVRPNVLYCIDLTTSSSSSSSSMAWEAFEMIRREIVPALAEHFQTQQEAAGRRLVAPSVGIAFSMGRDGVYLMDKRNKSMVVMSDTLDDPYSPLPLTEFSWNLAEEFEQFQECWTELAESFLPPLLQRAAKTTQTQTDSCCCSGGAAMKFLVESLRETGGRAVWISSQRPSYGVGAIANREATLGTKAYTTTCESWLYTPLQDALPRAKADLADQAASTFYSKLGEDCTKYKVAMDIVMLQTATTTTTTGETPLFWHAATLSKVCQVSNGRFVWIVDQQRGMDWRAQFRTELLRPLLQFSGWDAVLKVRCSSGLRVQGITSGGVGIVTQASNSLTDDSPEVELVTVTPDTCIAVTLDHRVGGLPKKSQFAYVQTALLYTNPWTGQRRLRVSTLALRTATTPAIAFRSMDFGCIATLLMRQAVAKMIPDPSRAAEKSSATEESMQMIMDTVLNILAAYRKYGSSRSQAQQLGQFVLPDKLKLLPLLCMSLRKSPMFRNSLKVYRGGMSSSLMPSPTADERAYALYHASRCTPATAMYLLHPILLDMTTTTTTTTTTDEDGSTCNWVDNSRIISGGNTMDMLQNSPFVRLPEALQASISNMADDKVYLLDTMMTFYILVGKDVPVETIQPIQQAMSSSSSSSSSSFEEDHPIGRAIHQLRLFSQVGREPRWFRPCHAPVLLVHHDDPLFQSSILKWMICDATDQEREYNDFLIHLHRNVESRMKSV
jgi:hypothetical protein